MAEYEVVSAAGRQFSPRYRVVSSTGGHLGLSATLSGSPGAAIVVANAGRVEVGSWGGLLSVAARQRSLARVLTHGAYEDLDETRELRFPVFTRSSTARGRIYEQSCQEPVRIGPLTACSGDLVRADGTAVVVVPAGQAAAVFDQAEQIAARESAMAEEIRGGAVLPAVLGVRYEDMLAQAKGGNGV